MSESSQNSFLDAPLSHLYVKTALPIILIMGMNGFLTVVDAFFLGHYVGADALSAVTLIFPLYMVIVALATLVASGMSSILARYLGGARREEAQRLFASAHWLALCLGGVLILLYLAVGAPMVQIAAGGAGEIAEMAQSYLQILVVFSPVLFILSVNSDALRNEGRVGLMAAMSLLVSLSNIGFNYLLIAVWSYGVVGSAVGTVLAQAVALAIILAVRLRGQTTLRPGAVLRHVSAVEWRPILALGAPQSLNFLGIALGSSAILMALQMFQSPNYAATVSAYGITTRVITFAFLPLLGLSQAMQTITGNNTGAGLWQRRDQSLRVAVFSALVYCGAVQVFVTVFARQIGASFVDDPQVIAETAAILPVMSMLFVLAGPLMMLAAHFQAIGDAPRAAVLGLSKPYLFALPMTFILPFLFGSEAVWWAGPMAELMLLGLAALVLYQRSRREMLRWGLFSSVVEDRA
ncbi:MULTISPECIES: MATE family efflux transporter [Shimia]|uniref:MATE family efflux transporter n=1 Tax=Shimia TaxID=573139 RepID=UPI001FB4F40E|nr:MULTISPECIES: MATE family efflux transporter [Shimia]MDV4143542.1 MATE family efflux transporter [Shimia sp. FJ5]